MNKAYKTLVSKPESGREFERSRGKSDGKRNTEYHLPKFWKKCSDKNVLNEVRNFGIQKGKTVWSS